MPSQRLPSGRQDPDGHESPVVGRIRLVNRHERQPLGLDGTSANACQRARKPQHGGHAAPPERPRTHVRGAIRHVNALEASGAQALGLAQKRRFVRNGERDGVRAVRQIARRTFSCRVDCLRDLQPMGEVPTQDHVVAERIGLRVAVVAGESWLGAYPWTPGTSIGVRAFVHGVHTLGALVRTYLTLLALFLTVRFMVFPMAVEWRQERKRAREARLRAEIQRAS